MYQADMNKLDAAIRYVQRIGDGYHPTRNKPLAGDTVIEEPSVIRCMFFIKEVLEEVRRSGGAIGGKKRNQKETPFPFGVLKDFRYDSDKPITHLIRQFQGMAGDEEMEKLSYKPVSDWLKTAGYLTKGFSQEVGKEVTMPTEKGRELGIYTELRAGAIGTYLVVIYAREAQEFLARNLEAILNGRTDENMKK